MTMKGYVYGMIAWHCFFQGEGWKAFTACMIAFTTKLDHVIQQQVHICKHSDVNMNPRFRTFSLQQSTMVALKNLFNPLDKLGWHGLLFIATSHVSIPMWRILKVFLDLSARSEVYLFHRQERCAVVAESLRAASAAVEVGVWMRFGLTFGLNCGRLVTV